MIANFQLAALVILFLMVAIAVLLWFCRTPASSTSHKSLFTPSGRAFFGQLDLAVRSHCVVFPEIPVSSLIQTRSFSRSQSLLSRFKGDVFDYAICDRKTMDLKCVIIHNNKSYKSQKKTEALAKLCQYADIVLLHFDEKPYRNVPALRKQIFISCGINESELPENHRCKYTMVVSQGEGDAAVTTSIQQEGSDRAPAERI